MRAVTRKRNAVMSALRPPQCESCARNLAAGDGVAFEGFLVCIECRSTKASELSERRRREDEETLRRIG
jgi:hypothetical protein